VLIVAGCGGGSDRLSAQGYARAAGAVCARVNRVVVRIELTSASDVDAVRALRRVVDLHRRAIDDLRDLRPPERLAGTVQRWIALLDQGADELDLMRARLRAGEDAEAADYGAKATTLFDRARDLVAPLRVTSCNGPELPSP
jgi:hypothetical protein